MSASVASKFSFASGEVSREIHARLDLAQRQNAFERSDNMVVITEGGLTRTPGTRFVAPLKDEARPGLFLPFRFSKTDAFMLVFNAGVMRVYRNGGIVETSPGVAYEVSHPYTDADLPNMRWQQVTDTIFIVCKGQPPRRLKRESNTNWVLDLYVTTSPALEPQNTNTALQIDVTALTGVGVMTSSSALFLAGHQGTVWRLDESSLGFTPLWKANETVASGDLRRWQGRTYRVSGTGGDTGPNPPVHTEGNELSGAGNVGWDFVHGGFGYAQIDSLNSATSANITVVGSTSIPSSVQANNTSRWFEAAWSGVRGWPEHIGLLDQSLVFARGDTIWKTRPGDLYDFEIDGTTESALVIRLPSPDGQFLNIEWMQISSIIVVGTSSSVWLIRGPSPYDPLTISNVRPIPDKDVGSAPHRPVSLDGGVMLIDNTRRDLHFAGFDRVAETLDMRLATQFARHILASGARMLAFQRAPHRLVWVACDNGGLVAMTFQPQQELTACHRHPVPGAFVEQVAVMPGQETPDDEVWMICRRTINGASRRYIEQMRPFFTPVDAEAPSADGAWFVSCGLPFPAAKPLTAITRANPAVVTCTAHGFAAGDVVECSSLSGPNGERLTGAYIVRSPATNTFQLEQNGVLVDASAWALFTFSGTAARQVSTLSGLGHLEGQTVAILADGAVQPRRVVTGGSITLAQPAATGVVGLPLPWRVKLLPLEVQTQRGFSKGDFKQATMIIVDVVHAAGGRMRVNGGEWEPLMPTGGDLLGVPLALTTGAVRVNPATPSARELVIEFEGDDPLPFTLTGITAAPLTLRAG